MNNEIEKKALPKSAQDKPTQSDKPKSAQDKPTQSDKHGSMHDKKPTATESPKQNNKRSSLLPIFALIVLLIISFYFYKEVNQLQQKTIQNAEQIKAEQIKTDGIIIEKLNHSISDTNLQFTRIQQKLEELESKQDVLSHSLSQPLQQQIHINKDYALEEIEHLLIVASYNLELDHNIVTALAAMEAADARLIGLDDPQTVEVRQQLIADMNDLRSFNQADLSGLGLLLSDLVGRVDTLPLQSGIIIEPIKNEVNTEQPEVTSIRHFFSLVWEELKSLVVITRKEHANKAQLLPDEIYFIRANIKLELANARFALFNRDSNNLRASIRHIQMWLHDYFDLDDAAVQNINDSLTEMNTLELAFPKLDISGSLESVRALIRYQDEAMPAQDSQERLQ